jgi:pimeloyl-ACP methyl ester carboxylesterase
VWADRRLGIATAAAVAAGWGLLAGWWTPRGPLTTAEALWSIAISLVVGGIAGFVSKSRWSMLAAPVAFAVVFELVRLGTDGPTVDGIETSTYGLLAFAVGRGFHAFLSLFPMVLGAAVGAGVARGLDPGADRQEARHVGRSVRRGVAIIAAIALIGLTVGLTRPASTDPIVDANGDVVPGSVAELTTVEVNGHDLALMIRGHSVDNPVLLFLAGGPGGSEFGAMRNHLSELEEHFTVVTWDQRGTGRSYDELDPTDTITLDGFVDDTFVVTDHLRDRFDQERIYLLGQSWGSTLGVLAVQEHPERYEAFIGAGQMVSQLATDTIFYQDTLAWAQDRGDADLVAELLAIGAPPYERMLGYESALSYEHEVYPYDHGPNAEGQGGFSENFIVDEYALIDQAHLLGGFLDTFSVLYPQLQDIDFRDTATEFDVPMFFVQGAHEADGRARVFEDWYPTVEAPIKDLTVLGTSGHRPLWEQPDEFVDYMVGTVLAATSDTEEP